MLRLQRTAQRCGTPASLSEPVYQRCVVWPDALELLLVAARPTFAEPDVVACAARPGALALTRFAGFVAAQPPFAEPDVAGRLARPDALALRLFARRVAERQLFARRVAEQQLFAGRVAERQLFAEPGVVARPVLLGRDALPVLLLPVLLLPALAASVLAHRHSMAVSLQPKSELLSIAKVFS
jgi:hypothetical protein